MICSFEFNCSKETAIEEILKDTEKSTVVFEDVVIYGRKWGNFVNLYHGITYKNSWRPIFTAYFKEVEPGKTIVKGLFRWNLFVMAFSLFWLSAVGYIGFNIATTAIRAFWVPLLFILFFVALTFFSTFAERKNMKKIIEHIEKCQKNINGEM